MKRNMARLCTRSTLFFFCLWVLVEPQLAIAGLAKRDYKTRHHAKVAQNWQSRRAENSDWQPRQTKFSNRGIYGIRDINQTARIDGTFIGIIPDAGDTGGRAQTMQEIIKSLNGKKPATYGWYAQVKADETFRGDQLFEVMDDVKKCGCVFNPAIMPPPGWGGLKYNDDHQAVAIAKVLRKFTDEGIPVILRFAHEANWYQRTGQYSGTVADFKEAYHVVGKRIRQICPDCILQWAPNIANMKEYEKYEPYEMDKYVDVVGPDYYPKTKPKAGDFVKVMKDFHDKYAVNGRKFAIGETGLHYAGNMEERVDWLTQIAQSKQQLPNLVYVAWYNSVKEFDYKIAGNGEYTKLLTEKLE